MGAVIGAVVAMMGAIASALAAGVVTAPLAIPVTGAAIALAIAGGAAMTAGEAAVLGATAAAGAGIAASLAVPGFARGGIGNFGGGTEATLHGQEAIIPLNSRGAAFMQDAMGGTGGGNMTVVMQVDGREMARKTMQYMPGLVYMKTGLA